MSDILLKAFLDLVWERSIRLTRKMPSYEDFPVFINKLDDGSFILEFVYQRTAEELRVNGDKGPDALELRYKMAIK